MPEPSALTGSAARPVFLSAEWRKLILANYAVDPAILRDHLPHRTELDFFHDTCYVSLVGFHFANVRLKGIPIPFHTDFEEVNLRFYVRYRNGSGWQRGVVFIREFVRKPALTFVAHTLYGEHYQTVPMDHRWQVDGDPLLVRYRWKKQRWHSLEVTASATPHDITVGSEEEFITEHNRGYTSAGRRTTRTAEYAVEHPTWQVYPIVSTAIDVDFAASYGEHFRFLNDAEPRSVFLAEGSPIVVRHGVRVE
ncbi:MAG: DUF2071 domain-containing protein [Flavobacteriales bacterium]